MAGGEWVDEVDEEGEDEDEEAGDETVELAKLQSVSCSHLAM